MQQFFLKHCSLYRRVIHRLFGRYPVRQLSFNSGIYGDENVHYIGFDKHGNVQKGWPTLRDALRNRGTLGITVLYDRY